MWSRAERRACSAASVAVSPRVPPWKCVSRRVAHVIGVPAVAMRVQLVERRQLAAEIAVQRGRSRIDDRDDHRMRLLERADERGHPGARPATSTSVGIGVGTGPVQRGCRSVVTKPTHPGAPMADGISSSAASRNCRQRVERLAARLRTARRPTRAPRRARCATPAATQASRRVRRRAVDVHAQHRRRAKVSRQTAELFLREQCVRRFMSHASP